MNTNNSEMRAKMEIMVSKAIYVSAKALLVGGKMFFETIFLPLV